MGFTTPCFIRKNTPELRKKLEELGYEILNSGNTTLDEHNYDGKGSHKSIEEGKAIITSYGNLYGVIYNVDTVTKKGRIDCGTNEELFLAIAALRDDSNYMQWFIADSILSGYHIEIVYFLVLAMRKKYWLNLLKMLVSDTINVLDVLLTNIIPIILHNIVNLFQGSRYV